MSQYEIDRNFLETPRQHLKVLEGFPIIYNFLEKDGNKSPPSCGTTAMQPPPLERKKLRAACQFLNTPRRLYQCCILRA